MTAAATTSANNSGTLAEQKAAATQALKRILSGQGVPSTADTQNNSHSSESKKQSSLVSADMKSNANAAGVDEVLSKTLSEQLHINGGSKGAGAGASDAAQGTSPQYAEPIRRVNTSMIYKNRRADYIQKQLEEHELSERQALGEIPELVIDSNKKSNGTGRAALMLAAGITPPPPLSHTAHAVLSPPPLAPSSTTTTTTTTQSSAGPSITSLLTRASEVQQQQEKKKRTPKKAKPAKPDAAAEGVVGAPSASKTAMLMSMLGNTAPPSSVPAPASITASASTSATSVGPTVVAADAGKALLSFLSSPKAATAPLVVVPAASIAAEKSAIPSSPIPPVSAPSTPVVSAPVSVSMAPATAP